MYSNTLVRLNIIHITIILVGNLNGGVYEKATGLLYTQLVALLCYYAVVSIVFCLLGFKYCVRFTLVIIGMLYIIYKGITNELVIVFC
jgi:hypothetical protein